jgi:hypothetical protein
VKEKRRKVVIKMLLKNTDVRKLYILHSNQKNNKSVLIS